MKSSVKQRLLLIALQCRGLIVDLIVELVIEVEILLFRICWILQFDISFGSETDSRWVVDLWLDRSRMFGIVVRVCQLMFKLEIGWIVVNFHSSSWHLIWFLKRGVKRRQRQEGIYWKLGFLCHRETNNKLSLRLTAVFVYDISTTPQKDNWTHQERTCQRTFQFWKINVQTLV